MDETVLHSPLASPGDRLTRRLRQTTLEKWREERIEERLNALINERPSAEQLAIAAANIIEHAQMVQASPLWKFLGVHFTISPTVFDDETSEEAGE